MVFWIISLLFSSFFLFLVYRASKTSWSDKIFEWNKISINHFWRLSVKKKNHFSLFFFFISTSNKTYQVCLLSKINLRKSSFHLYKFVVFWDEQQQRRKANDCENWNHYQVILSKSFFHCLPRRLNLHKIHNLNFSFWRIEAATGQDLDN